VPAMIKNNNNYNENRQISVLIFQCVNHKYTRLTKDFLNFHIWYKAKSG